MIIVDYIRQSIEILLSIKSEEEKCKQKAIGRCFTIHKHASLRESQRCEEVGSGNAKEG
jgi:hypothetical protein